MLHVEPGITKEMDNIGGEVVHHAIGIAGSKGYLFYIRVADSLKGS